MSRTVSNRQPEPSDHGSEGLPSEAVIRALRRPSQYAGQAGRAKVRYGRVGSGVGACHFVRDSPLLR